MNSSQITLVCVILKQVPCYVLLYSPMEGTRTALTARWKAHVLLYSPMEGTRSVLLPDGRHTYCPTARWKAHVLSYCPIKFLEVHAEVEADEMIRTDTTNDHSQKIDEVTNVAHGRCQHARRSYCALHLISVEADDKNRCYK